MKEIRVIREGALSNLRKILDHLAAEHWVIVAASESREGWTVYLQRDKP